MKKQKKKQKKNNDTKKILITLAIVILIIVIIGGATFAYWSWETNTAQRTNVTVTVEGATLTIEGNNITNTGMYPTDVNPTDSTNSNYELKCNGAAVLQGDVATVTADNHTESPMQAALKIRATLTRNNGSSFTTTIDGQSVDTRSYLKWAIIELASATATPANDACTTNAIASGTLAGAGTNTDIDTGITFIANASSVTTKYYKLYIWLDSSYEHVNSGDTISDPMQDLNLSVKWSQESKLNQEY